MTAIAGRLGEFWVGAEVAAGVATNVDQPTADGGTLGVATPGPDPESIEVPVGSASAPTGIILSSLVDATFNGNVDELETTVHNTAGTYGLSTVDHNTARTYIPNFHDETLDLTLRYDESDVAQANILFCAMQSKLFYYWYLPDGPAFLDLGATNARQFNGAAFATSFSPGSPLDDVATLDISLRLSGSVMVIL